MKILIVGLNYDPEPVGIGPYTAGLARTLAAAGHEVHAIVGEPYYPAWRRMPEYSGIKTRIEAGVVVERRRHYIPAVPTGARRVVHYLSFVLSSFAPVLRAALGLRPDIVFTVAPTLLTTPTAWLAARISGARLWTHVQDFEAEAALATGLLHRGSLVGRFARWLERRLLRMADRVSTISPQMMSKLVELGIPAARSYQLRNWANAGFTPDPAEAERYRREWQIGDRKVVLYSGSIANKQGIEIIVDAARALAARADLMFVICGQGPNRAHLARLAQGLDNVRLHDLQPAERMGGLLALAYMHCLPQIPEAADLVLPSKLSNMLGSRRPVVATAERGTGLAEEVCSCGIVTPPGDVDALAAAITRLADDPDLAAQLGASGGARAEERWSQVEILRRLEAEFARITRAPGGMAEKRRGSELTSK